MPRQNIRNVSIWERSNALNCNERTNIVTSFRVAYFLCITGSAFMDQFDLSLMVGGLALLVEVIKMERTPASCRPPIIRQVITFDTFGEKSRELLGFRQSDLRHIHAALNWPETLTVIAGEDLTKSFQIDGAKAFTFLLYRHHMPNNLTHTEAVFGWDYSVASRVFTAAENWMIQHHGHRQQLGILEASLCFLQRGLEGVDSVTGYHTLQGIVRLSGIIRYRT